MDDLRYFIAMVVTFALADSIDPCFFAIYASILASVSSSVYELRRVFYVGVSFIASVAIGYFLIGYIIRSFVGALPIGRNITAYVLIAYGVVVSAMAVLHRGNTPLTEACREDQGVTCRVVNAISERTLTTLRMRLPYLYASLVGFLASFTILPCSAGLYIVYNVATAYLGLYMWVLLTILYVSVFISPLLLLSLAIVGLLRISRKLYLKHFNSVKLLGGLLSVVVGIYVLLTTSPS